MLIAHIRIFVFCVCVCVLVKLLQTKTIPAKSHCFDQRHNNKIVLIDNRYRFHKNQPETCEHNLQVFEFITIYTINFAKLLTLARHRPNTTFCNSASEKSIVRRSIGASIPRGGMTVVPNQQRLYKESVFI